MITNRNPVYSALWFALVTLSVCGLFLVAVAPFLAAATVIVYAGAIVVTFVFVIMLAQQSGATVYDQRSRQPFLATVSAFLLLGVSAGHVAGRRASDDFHVADAANAGRGNERAQSIRRRTQDRCGHAMTRARPLAVWRLFVCGRTRGHAAAGGHDWRDCDRAATSPRDAMMGDVERYLAVGAALFVLGAIGFLHAAQSDRDGALGGADAARRVAHAGHVWPRASTASKGRALRFSFSRWRLARRGWRCR